MPVPKTTIFQHLHEESPTPAPHTLTEGTTYVCLNCGTSFVGDYCPACGQAASTRRISFRSALNSFFDTAFNLDGLLLHTLLELYLRPGYMVRDYIRGHRVSYINPIKLMLFLVTVKLLVLGIFNIENDHIEMVGHETVKTLSEGSSLQHLLSCVAEILNNEFYMELIMALLFAFPAKLCFSRTPYGSRMCLAEHFAAWIYFAVQVDIVGYLLGDALELLLPYNVAVLLQVGVIAFLVLRDYRQLMGIGWKRSILLTSLSFALLGILALTIILSILIPLILFGVISK